MFANRNGGEMNEIKELKVMYGEEDRDETNCCVGCDFHDKYGCTCPAILDSGADSHICMISCKKNITNGNLILTKEKTERSICKIVKLSGGEWKMDLLEPSVEDLKRLYYMRVVESFPDGEFQKATDLNPRLRNITNEAISHEVKKTKPSLNQIFTYIITELWKLDAKRVQKIKDLMFENALLQCRLPMPVDSPMKEKEEK